MALVLFVGLGLAALRDPSMWWVGAVVGCLIGLLLTACIGAIYRTGRERAFWVGIVVFGGGYLLLIQVLSSDGTGNPVAFINRVLDTPSLDVRSAPTAGSKVLAPFNSQFRPASVVEVDRTGGAYFVKYDGGGSAWLNTALVKLRSDDDYSAVGNKLVMILVAMLGSVVAVAFYDSSERRRGEQPSRSVPGLSK